MTLPSPTVKITFTPPSTETDVSSYCRSVTIRRGRSYGTMLDRIDTADGRWAVACALGGDERRTLCCATAATTLEGMPQGRSTARLEFTEVAAPGAAPIGDASRALRTPRADTSG